ncbi:MAG TPA: MazG nucleotide pyrophosphohydrolase domain-containing protein [Candidatus Omnitrophota bacterium]|nr:MazG nucleotide pyrophosphohydrolase domain-containing protein [Candidatus Omnitrophota bacterium]
MKKTHFTELKKVFKRLRGPKGCPWDREQTHESLIKGLEEETRELIEAIKSGDREHMKEELGDVLLHVMFQAEIASESGAFDAEDVISGLVEKLKRRHPHVFGNKKVKSSAHVVRNWNRIKAGEKKKSGKKK